MPLKTKYTIIENSTSSNSNYKLPHGITENMFMLQSEDRCDYNEY